jgi:hypothetical protein
LLGAHLADLLFTDRRWRDGAAFSFLKSAAGSDGPFRYSRNASDAARSRRLPLRCVVLRDIEIAALRITAQHEQPPSNLPEAPDVEVEAR